MLYMLYMLLGFGCVLVILLCFEVGLFGHGFARRISHPFLPPSQAVYVFVTVLRKCLLVGWLLRFVNSEAKNLQRSAPMIKFYEIIA